LPDPLERVANPEHRDVNLSVGALLCFRRAGHVAPPETFDAG